jgi:hypothetical protein
VSSSDEQEHGFQQPVVTRIVRPISTKSTDEQCVSTASMARKHPALSAINTNSSVRVQTLALDSSQTSSMLYVKSSTNLVQKSDIVDQEFHLNGFDDTKKSDVKSHGSIKINSRVK